MGKKDFDRWWNGPVQRLTIESRYQAAQMGWIAAWWYWGKQGIDMGLIGGVPIGILIGWLIWRG